MFKSIESCYSYVFYLLAASKKKSGSEKRDNRATTMIIIISFIYFFGNFIDATVTFLTIFGVDIYDDTPMLVVIDNVYLFGSHSLVIFPYFIYNKSYNAFFKNTFLPRKYHVSLPSYSTTLNNSVASNNQTNRLE